MRRSTKSSPGTEERGNLWITILAGGSGSRFWPVSRPDRPKQVLSLTGDGPLVAESLERASALVPFERLRVLAGTRLIPQLQEAMPDLPPSCFMAEPEAKGTAPVLAWAAWVIEKENPGAVLVSLHADHHIEPLEEFTRVVLATAEMARRDGLLMTVGATPDRPETGYGYIRTGAELEVAGGLTGFRVSAFHEKPDHPTAERYLRDGLLWNTGIFVWRAATFLDELAECAPEIGDRMALLESGDAARFFREVPNITVDVAVMERSQRVGVVPATFQWDDVGAWHSLSRIWPEGPGQNVIVGSGQVVQGSGNVVFVEQGQVVLFAVDDLVVVRTGEITLVTRKDRSGDLKVLLDQLDESPGDSS